MKDFASRRLDFSDVSLYGVTSAEMPAEKLLTQIQKALAGGVDAIQLRVHNRTDREIFALGKQVKAACQSAGALFIVDNRADLAVALDADGIHVGHTDLPVSLVRNMLGHRKIVGVSSHSLPEALDAQRAGADYVSCGPIWPTPTKPTYNAVGLNLIGMYRAALRIPFVAIGGIDETNIDQVLQAGAKCVAVVRALFESPDAEAIAKLLKGRMYVK
jgi:thiamine-phosphate pyrophosphorylase